MPDWPTDPTEPDERTESHLPDDPGAENPSTESANPPPPAEPGRDRDAGGGEVFGGEAAEDLASGGGSITGAPSRRLGAEEALERIDAPLRRRSRRRGRVPAGEERRPRLSPRQRLLLLDTWGRSGLSGPEFSSMVGVSATTLYKWKKRFDEEGPAALEDSPRKRGGSRLPDVTRRAIVMLKKAHPDWGQDRIHDTLLRTEGFAASPGAIGRVLEEEGYVTVDAPTRPHPDKPRRFERARPNQLWQTDLFTFTLKRENRRVHLVAFMDDHSRFIAGYALSASSSGNLVREAFEDAVANFGLPEEVLTDNGPQYVTWRGKSAFTKLLERRGVKQIVARPRRPQTLGKIERFWQTLWRECLEAAIFRGLDDARERIGHFVGYYNFQRTHAGIGGLVPADRFFDAAADVRGALEARVEANALEIARNGTPRKPFYIAGRVGEQSISLHGEGERVVLTREDGSREEVDLGAPGPRVEGRAGPKPDSEARSSSGPGTSRLDDALDELAREWPEDGDHGAGDVEDTVDGGAKDADEGASA